MLYCIQHHIGARCHRVSGKTPFLYRKVLEDKETVIIFRRYYYEVDNVVFGRAV